MYEQITTIFIFNSPIILFTRKMVAYKMCKQTSKKLGWAKTKTCTSLKKAALYSKGGKTKW
jgi:hypothetical protein